MSASQAWQPSPPPARPAISEPPQRPAAVQLRARRDTRLVVIGILCACLGALVMAWAWSGTQQSQQVVLMTSSVARGQVIESHHLTTTTIGRAQGVSVLPAEQASELVGQHARTDLPAGSLVGPDSVGASVVPAGAAHVGLRVAAGQLPNQPLPVGAYVTLVEVPSGMDAEREPGAEFGATVATSPVPTTDGGSWLLDVQVDQYSASSIAALAAAERIAIVRNGDG